VGLEPTTSALSALL